MAYRPSGQYIVITSVAPPTEAVIQYSKLRDYRLIVVGDKKSPSGWSCEGVDYISVEQQARLAFEMAASLPYNHYCRKMIGYLRAIQSGATVIVDTDDDNIPKKNWCFPALEGEYDEVEGEMGFVNVYRLYSDQQIWPRGFPLHLIRSTVDPRKNISRSYSRIGVWQGLADGDPDVDAVYRLTSDTPCFFDSRNPVVLGRGTISPFNSQNTLIRKELFLLLYLPTTVTFRFTDILRGLVAQPIMWLYGYHLGFTNATVVQKRNPHDYRKDFELEIPMYRYSADIVDIVASAISSDMAIEANLFSAYTALAEGGVVDRSELHTLEAWLKDFESCASPRP